MTKIRYQHSFNLDEATEKRLNLLIEEHGVKIIDIIKTGLDKIEGEKLKK